MQLAESHPTKTSGKPFNNLRFLEYSIACENVLQNLEFFQQLGFSTLATNDIWNYPYAVISDGRCFLGLHEKRHFEELSVQARLSFVHEHIAPIVKHLREHAYTILKSGLADDEFQHTVFKDSNQAVMHIMAARSFSPPPKENCKDSMLGYFSGIVIPTANLEKASEFWEKIGLLVMPSADKNTLSVSANHLNLLLIDNAQQNRPGFLFEHANPESLLMHCERYGISVENTEPDPVLDSEYLLKAPNGLHLWVKRDE